MFPARSFRSRTWLALAVSFLVAGLGFPRASGAPAGLTWSILAGNAGGTGDRNGAVAQALFNQPYGVAVDGAGNVFVFDSNLTIRKISAAGVVSTLARYETGVARSYNAVGSVAFTATFADGRSALVRIDLP